MPSQSISCKLEHIFFIRLLKINSLLHCGGLTLHTEMVEIIYKFLFVLTLSGMLRSHFRANLVACV